jgi:hypothetical protein
MVPEPKTIRTVMESPDKLFRGDELETFGIIDNKQTSFNHIVALTCPAVRNLMRFALLICFTSSRLRISENFSEGDVQQPR